MGDKLWPTFKKFSMSTEPITLSPLGLFLLLYELTDNTWTTLLVHSMSCLYTSLGFQQITHRSKQMTYVFGIDICFRKSEYAFSSPTSKNICWEQLSWPRSWIWLATFVSAVIEHLKRTFFTNQRQQKQFFLQLEICMRKVCVLKK